MPTQTKYFDPAEFASDTSAQAAIARANEFLKIAENVSGPTDITRGLNAIAQALVQLEYAFIAINRDSVRIAQALNTPVSGSYLQ